MDFRLFSYKSDKTNRTYVQRWHFLLSSHIDGLEPFLQFQNVKRKSFLKETDGKESFDLLHFFLVKCLFLKHTGLSKKALNLMRKTMLTILMEGKRNTFFN